MRIIFVRHGHPDYTAITIVTFSEKKGILTAPRFELVNDARHIRK